MSTRYVWGDIIGSLLIPKQRLTPYGSLLVARYHATNQLEKSTRISP